MSDSSAGEETEVEAPSKERLSPEALRQRNQLLYEIIAQTGHDFDAQMRHALARATDLLELDQGLLVRVQEDTYTLDLCHAPGGNLEAGQVFDCEDTYCSFFLERNDLLAIDHAAASDFRKHRCYEIFAFESYIGTPVHCDGQLYGTLAFSGTTPKQPPFTEADRSLVRLLGQWVGSVLERRRAEKARRKSEKRFRLLAENVSDMVCIQDLKGRCIYASPSARRVLGYAPEELIGVSPLELAHPEDEEHIRAAARRALRGEPDLVERLRLRHKDGSYRWCETAGHPVYAEDGQTIVRFLTSTRDVSERVAAERAFERSNETLRHRNRELQDFAYIASHDLQEPLRKVRAFAGLMREDYADEVDQEGRYYLERMEDGAERMARLVSDLLSLSRVTTEGHPFETVELRKVAQEVRTDLQLRIEETDARVSIGELPTIKADRTQMRQLLQNLISNALKFHREGVPPVVNVYAEPEKEDDEADMCRLIVEDNGTGFEEKFANRIFTPLQRLHGREAYEGTGIGLAVCRRIAERHGGTIEAQSTPDKGSRFTVTLPRRRPGDEPSETGNALSGKVPFSSSPTG